MRIVRCFAVLESLVLFWRDRRSCRLGRGSEALELQILKRSTRAGRSMQCTGGSWPFAVGWQRLRRGSSSRRNLDWRSVALRFVTQKSATEAMLT